MIWKGNRGIHLVTIVLLVVVATGCSGGKRPRSAHDSYRFIREHNLGSLPKFDIPIEINDRVIAWMEYFQGPGRNHFRRYLERSGRYLPLMQEILRKNGMPQDLIYVALIESGFNTQARSYASAVGPWQFISSTGRRYGLRIDGWVDERRDPYKSTQAAVEYFKDLYGEFRDWYLAMAGYNGGEGRVRQAIDASGSRNFWEMSEGRSVFRAETRDYVPKFIAAAIMAKMPERFGFGKIDYKPPFNYETATVESQTDIPVLARCAGVSEDDVIDLNPHLVGGTTPPEADGYQIRLPKGTTATFKMKYAALPKEERLQIVRYQVRRGDTLARVARRYGVSSGTLAAANGLSSRQKRLPVGMTLTIPRGGSAAQYAKASDDDDRGRSVSRDRSDRRSRGKTSLHTVRRGETLSSIARRHGVTTSQLASWNRIRNQKKIHAGTKLKIVKSGGRVEEPIRVAATSPSPDADEPESKSSAAVPGKVHKVQKGETLSTIASRYGVTVKQLQALNNISGTKIRSGMRLTIRQPKTVAKAPAPATETPALSSEDVVEEARMAETRVKIASAKDHTISSGETLGGIAAKYGVTTKELMAMNDIKDPRSIRAGAKITVTKGSKSPSRAESAKKAPSEVSDEVAPPAPTGSEQGTTGSLSDSVLPMQPQTTAIDLREREATQSRMPRESAMATAQSSPAPEPAPTAQAAKPVLPEKAAVKTPPAKSAVSYKVKSGDTLWDIARRHKVSIAQIQKWNNLADPSSVKPGTTLTIHRE